MIQQVSHSPVFEQIGTTDENAEHDSESESVSSVLVDQNH